MLTKEKITLSQSKIQPFAPSSASEKAMRLKSGLSTRHDDCINFRVAGILISDLIAR